MLPGFFSTGISAALGSGCAARMPVGLVTASRIDGDDADDPPDIELEGVAPVFIGGVDGPARNGTFAGSRPRRVLAPSGLPPYGVCCVFAGGCEDSVRGDGVVSRIFGFGRDGSGGEGRPGALSRST
jgi:hypothetical protein